MSGGCPFGVSGVVSSRNGTVAGVSARYSRRAMLAGFLGRQARRGMRRPGGARLPVPSSSVMGPAGTGVHPAFLGDGCGGFVVVFGGGRNRGLGENLEPGRGFAGPGGFRVFPQCVSGLVSPPVCLLV
jgi:hypothetical protein